MNMITKIRRYVSLPFKFIAKIFLAMFLFFAVISSLIHRGLDQTVERLENFVERIKGMEE